MRSELLVGLAVEDEAGYARYRAEMTPLLEEAGGAFRYDFKVVELLQAPQGSDINRVFVISFPSRAVREAFFADPRYLEVRERLFAPAVRRAVVIAEFTVEEWAV